MQRLILAATLVAMATACYSGGTGATRPGGSGVLLRDEIMAAGDFSTAYDAVRHLRPQFLRNRGATSIRTAQPDPLIVYLNGVSAGGVDVLTRIPATDIQSIRYLNGRDATTRFGTGHGGGVLEVTTGN